MHEPTVRRLFPGLHLLEAEMEGFDVRAAVLIGAERAVVWDTLAHPDQMAGVDALLGGLPAAVVYSHADWDHAWGTCGLRRVVEVVAHEAATHRFDTDVPDELDRRKALDADAWGAVRLVPPTRTFVDTLALDLGGVTLELHALAGHTPDSAVGFVPEWGVLFAGDAVETPLPFVNEAAAVSGWAAGLGRWLADERVGTVIPAHGPVGGRELLERTGSYLRDLAAGRHPAVPDVLPPFYRDTHERNVRAMDGAGPASGN